MYPEITFTITTSRRLEFFKKTMESFLTTCDDKDLIKRWIIIDDRSEDRDIAKMKSLYPFFEIYRADGEGQVFGLNLIIFSKVDTEWFFHCEDDWLFLKKDNYIRHLFNVSFDDDRIKNITLRYWNGNVVRSEKLNIKYNLHQYAPVSEDNVLQILSTDCNWYGYTFNPGLHHIPTLRLMGRLDETVSSISRRWDRDHALRYYLLGYKRANLMDKYIKHIGEGRSEYVH